jgi:hypothetical protein
MVDSVNPRPTVKPAAPEINADQEIKSRMFTKLVMNPIQNKLFDA